MISKSIKLQNINKSFEQIEVINSFNLDINAGEFGTLLGPLAVGKQTFKNDSWIRICFFRKHIYWIR